MDYKYSRSLRIISTIVLSFFIWTFGGVFDIAYAIKSDQQSASSVKQKNKKPEEKFQKTIEDIEELLAETVTDTDTKKDKLKTKKSEIEALDVDIRKQFKETEGKIKDLPEVIKQRHRDFVKKYDENLNELRSNLDEIDKAKDKGEIEAKVKKARKHLEKVRPPKKHQKLDPNKLPHRTAEPVWIEPRTKPEEFEKEQGQVARVKGQGKPILIASNGSLDGLLNSKTPPPLSPLLAKEGMGEVVSSLSYQIALADIPSSADLAETVEVRFTDEIKEITGLLNNDPVLIYEFVKNNFEYEPYYGSLKGAQQTLAEQAGNDFDQASLIIALYRSIGIPARYVYGTIQVPIEKVIGWVGAPDALTAIKILSTNGIPVAKNPDGVITDLQIEHIWVEVFLPYDNYRGKINTPNSGGGTWIPVDPSFKQHFQNPSGINLFQTSGINVETILKNYTTTAKTNLPVREYLSLIKTNIELSMPDKRFYDLIWSNNIDSMELGLLPSTLEYEIIVTGYKTSEISDTLRHKISFYTTGSLLEESLSHTTSIPYVAGKRITLSYIPATVADESIVKQYGNIYDTPPYLIQVKPVLKIDGQTKAVGGAISMAVSHELRQTLFKPNGKIDDVVSTSIIAGAYYAIGLDLQRIPAKTLYQHGDKYLQLLDVATNSTDSDEIVGEFLHLLVTGYFEQKDLSNKFIANTMQFGDFKKTKVAVIGVDLSVSYVFSFPIKCDVGLMFLDVQRDVSNPIDMSGMGRTIKDFMQMDGMNGSFLESSIFETVFEVESVSTLKALSLATLAGISVYKITSDNANTYLPLLQINADVKADIVNALNQEMYVTISQKEIQLNQWKGVGYIIENPQTGEAAYMISGGLAGGSLTTVIADVKSLIKTGKMTKEKAIPYINNLIKKQQIFIPHPTNGKGNISSLWSKSRLDPVDKKRWKCHNGWDISLPTGNDVVAIADGTVYRAQIDSSKGGGYGKYIVLDHGLGVYSLYGHLDEFKVSLNDVVKEFDVIGKSGNTGHSTGPHLHFSVIITGDTNFKVNDCNISVDPMWFFGMD